MPPRKQRVHVVFDTNVVVGYYLSRKPDSSNQQVFRLWRDQRRLQLVVSDEVLTEYFEVLSRLNVSESLIKKLSLRFAQRKTVTHVNVGSRPQVSRDIDDNVFVATALAGKTHYVITNDKDLLEIPRAEQARLRIQILTPRELLALLKESQ